MRKLSLLVFILFCSACQFFNAEEKETHVYIVAEQSPIFKSDKCQSIKGFKEQKKCADNMLLSGLYAKAQYRGDTTQAIPSSKMIVEFIITESGQVETTNIIKGIEPTLDKTVTDYIKSTKWQPALFENNPVKFKINLPIQFHFE